MKIEDTEALESLEACRQAEPEVVELALTVALAARVEQPLLRRARLLLCPRLDAGAESALWFSPLVSSSSAGAIVIDRAILAHLREELRQHPPAWLPLARTIVYDAHKHEADALRLEEDIIWLAVNRGDSAAPEIDQELRRAVKAMVTASDQGLEVARWADRALVSFPEAALRTESAGLLAVGAASRLKANAQSTDWAVMSDLPQGASWLLPPSSISLAPAQIGVRLRQGELEVTPSGAVLSQILDLPGGESDALEIRWEDQGVRNQRLFIPQISQRISLPEECREVQIRSSSGIAVNLRVREEITRGLRFSADLERNFLDLPSNLRLEVESAIHKICSSSGFLGVEYSGGYLFRDAHHRFDIWYSVGGAPLSPSNLQTLEIQNIEPVRPHVFLSYDHSEARWAELIASLLPLHLPGSEVFWLDKRTQAWTEPIERALIKSTAAIVLASPIYLSSEGNGREMDRLLYLAKRQHLVFIPIRVTDLPDRAIPRELREFQFLTAEPLDRLGDDPKVIERVVESLARALGGGGAGVGGVLLRTLEGHADHISGVAVTRDGQRAVSASDDHTLKVWDVETGQLLATLRGHADYVSGVAVTPDGRRAVSASNDHTLKVWDVETGRELLTLAGHSRAVRAVAVTPDGQRAVSASDDHTLKVWDLDSGVALRTLEGHSDYVSDVAMTPDGKRAVSASFDKTLKVWDLETGRALRTLEGHSNSVLGVAVSADGRRAVSASLDQTLKVWDVETGRELLTLAGHSSAVRAVAVTPDGQRAVSASDDHTLKVWDVETGRELRTLEGHTDSVNAVAVTPDGRRAVSASDDHTLKVWFFFDEPTAAPQTAET